MLARWPRGVCGLRVFPKQKGKRLAIRLMAGIALVSTLSAIVQHYTAIVSTLTAIVQHLTAIDSTLAAIVQH